MIRAILGIALISTALIAPAQPTNKAIRGELDLQGWNFAENGITHLDGEWEFYWEQLLSPDDFRNDSAKLTAWAEIPGLWNGYQIDEHNTLSGNGFATYRIDFKVDTAFKVLGLRLHRIETAYKLWINGELITETGQIGQDRQSMKPAWDPKIVYFPVNSADNELIIQISNFKHKKGGIARSIVIGLPDSLQSQTNNLYLFDIFMIGVLLIMAFHHFGLFLLRRRELSILFFGLFSFSTAAYQLTSGEIILTDLIPGFNWELMVKMNYITNYWRVGAFAAFLGFLFHQEFKLKIIKGILWFSLIVSILILFVPAWIYTQSLMVFIVFGIAVMIYILYGLTITLVRKQEGAIYAIIGTTILLLTAINDILNDFAIIQTLPLIPLGVFIFIFFQSFMLSLRSVRSFESVEIMSQRLMTLDKIKNEFLSVNSYKLNIPLGILVKHIGASRGYLLIRDGSRWFIKAMSTMDKNVDDHDAPLEIDIDKDNEVQKMPYSIVDQAIGGKFNVVVNTANEWTQYKRDPYLKHNPVKSAMCMPLMEQHSIFGAIYLENDEQEHAFDNEKVKILDLLSSQLATLIDNSKIYQELEELNRTLEEKVEQRTAEVYQQKEEIEAQRDEIESKSAILEDAFEEIAIKNREITDSIKYAKRIQESILPSESFIKQVIPESFILYKPKDILSGDFYWIEHNFMSEAFGGVKTEKILIAAVDCTGHGVPGALMSIIGNNLLNYAVNELKQIKPSQILETLEEGIRTKLKQTDRKSLSKDGLDIALITYEHKTNVVNYAGAHNPLYLIPQGGQQVVVYKGDPFAIGGFGVHDIEKRFTNHRIKVKLGDTIYLFSDGYADQIGGPSGRKFMKAKFRELLLDISQMPLPEQKMILEKRLKDWQGNTKQIDDMLVMGIRF